MPNPEKNESEKEFIGRCIPILIDEGKEQDQAVAICYSIYREKGTGIKSPESKREEVKMNKNLQPMMEQESVEDLIKQLRDTRFSNESTRKDFISIIARLGSIPDPTARKVIKKIGDYMTDLGTEILNDSSSSMPNPEENEAGIIDMDKEPDMFEGDDVDSYNARRKAEIEDMRNIPKYSRRFV